MFHMLRVVVSCMNIGEISKFVKDLKSLSKFDIYEGKLDFLKFPYRGKKSCVNPTWHSNKYSVPDVGAQYFLGIENYILAINAPLKLVFNNLGEIFSKKFGCGKIQFCLIIKISMYIVGWYGRYQFLSLNSRTSFF